MGGILSNEERVVRTRSSKREDSTLGVPWDAHGYRYREQRKKRHRNRGKGRSRYESTENHGPRARSQSLDAILEELCLSETEGDTGKGTLIPRAKLSANNRGVEGKIHARRGLSQLGADTASLHAIHLHVERKALEKSRTNLRTSISLPFLDQSDWIGDMEVDQRSNGPPSYSQDFDACMRQLEAAERNLEAHTDMEITTLPRHAIRAKSPVILDDQPRSLTMPRGRNIKRQMTPTNDTVILPPEEDTVSNKTSIVEEKIEEAQEVRPEEEEDVDEEGEEVLQEIEDEKIQPIYEKRRPEKIIIIEPKESFVKVHKPNKKDSSHGWYSNLKEQFERLDKELGSRVKNQESSCRITGATLKGTKGTILPEDHSGTQRRHYFSQLVRSNKSLIDEELPDPDKVQNIRAMFQDNPTRLGGSLQNVSTDKPVDVKPERPKSALGGRKEDELRCLTPETVDNARRSDSQLKSGLDKGSQTDRNRMRSRWTDSGSMSSGVSSDLSSCETDQESCCRDQGNVTSSEDELDIAEKHYIQNEILERIRSFGTSVTYFGGQMIRCSVGPLVSPTTQAILEEIGQKQPNGNPGTRSFDEFYKKYKATTKKRKVGRTRSFAQEEMFQRPSVFNNTEIEQHKRELETAFGIRRPRGKQPTSSKARLGKSFSLDSQLQNFEKSHDYFKAIVEPIPRRENISQVQETVAQTKVKVGKEYFDYNQRMKQPKIDMEFEEFEVCESLASKVEKLAEKRNSISTEHSNSRKDEVADSTDSLASTQELININKQSCITKILNETENCVRNESSGSETVGNDDNLSDEDFKGQRENSVKQKRESWEEVIQRARKSNDSFTRKEPSECNNQTEDKTMCFNNIENNLITCRSIRKAERTENINNDEIGIQSFDRNKTIESNKANDVSFTEVHSQPIEASVAKKSAKVDTSWESFLKHKRHNSIESFMTMNNAPYDSNSGRRRNSVKKLVDNEMTNRDFCLERRGNSSEIKKLSIGGRRFSIDSIFSDNTSRKSEQSQSISSWVHETKKKSEDKMSVSIIPIGGNTSNSQSLNVGESTVANVKRSWDGKMNQHSDQTKSNQIKLNEEDNTKKEQAEYKITIKISQAENEPYKIGCDQFEEIVINDEDQLDSLELYFPKPETQNSEENKETNKKTVRQEGNSSPEYKRRFDKNKNYKPSHSRWPIETSVVVDMEKREETIPKLISNGKSHVKTTRRLF